ncbi:unnamed protein product, partial [Ascophyllum nodosum]
MSHLYSRALNVGRSFEEMQWNARRRGKDNDRWSPSYYCEESTNATRRMIYTRPAAIKVMNRCGGRRCVAKALKGVSDKGEVEEMNLRMDRLLYEMGLSGTVAILLDSDDTAEKLLRYTLAFKKAMLGKCDLQVVYTLYELGVCTRDAGRYDEAEEVLRQQALVINEIKLGEDNPRTATTLHELGVCIREAGRHND